MNHILSKLRRGGELNGGGNGIVVVTSDQERTRGGGVTVAHTLHCGRLLGITTFHSTQINIPPINPLY